MFDLIWFLAPIAIIYLLIGQSRLKRRLSAVEARAAGWDAAQRHVEPPVSASTPLSVPVLEPPDFSILPETEAADIIAAPAPVPEPAPSFRAVPEQTGPIIFRADRFAQLFAWLRANWFYAVSAVSLALAGIFLVQFGIEQGLISPALRVMSGIALGAALIAGGEWLRRRYGDGETSGTAYLPETFCGAGVVAIFAAILAAHQLYGLIGPGTAFAGLVLVSVLAMVLGWFHGALMTAMGLLGAAAVPFVVSSTTGAGPWLFGYFGLIATVGLAVDSLRRWAWISALALAVGFGGGWAMQAAGAGGSGWVVLLVVLALLAVVLPQRAAIPRQGGPAFADLAMMAPPGRLAQGKPDIGEQNSGRMPPVWPPFPLRLSAGSGLAAILCLLAVTQSTAPEAMLAMAALGFLAIAYLLWAEQAAGMWDHGFVAAAAFVLALWVQGLHGTSLWEGFVVQAIDLRPPETAAPATLLILLAIATAMSGAFALRALRQGPHGLAFGLGAVLVAPAAVLGAELGWNPSPVMGAYVWALTVIALAAAMVGLATAFARADGDDRRRAAHATLAALSLVTLALFLILTLAALNIALGVMLVVAAMLDRRFRLPEMGLFIFLGVLALAWRLVVDPGLDHQMTAPLPELFLGSGGALLAMGATLYLLWPLAADSRLRNLAKAGLESALASLSALFLNVLITRGTDHLLGPYSGPYAWQMALNALPWIAMAWSQMRRAAAVGVLRRLHHVLAGLAAVVAGLLLLGGATLLVSLLEAYPDASRALVAGPPVLDTLALAYALPGVLLLAVSLQLANLHRVLRLGLQTAAVALLALYIGLEIRRFWQGDFIGLSIGVKQAELYSYTVALMLVGAGLLYQAIARRSAGLRLAAMGVIGLTVAKVFLIDASGLSGLTRVASFLGLGLALAVLAWLNRWADARSKG